MINFLLTATMVALGVSFSYALFAKWGIIEMFQVHADGWIAKVFPKYRGDLFNRLFNCIFCTTWWISVLVCLILATVCKDLFLVTVPIFSTPICVALCGGMLYIPHKD